MQVKDLYKEARAKYEASWRKVEQLTILTEQKLLTDNHYDRTCDPLIIHLDDHDDSSSDSDDNVTKIDPIINETSYTYRLRLDDSKTTLTNTDLDVTGLTESEE